mmetsp:Transcript_4736/g.13716  ORF Transcript_4736/g.13716 Transcript_4736/m.13716 type:complete len:245 (-) Transcript_4736:807-1541(-)
MALRLVLQLLARQLLPYLRQCLRGEGPMQVRAAHNGVQLLVCDAAVPIQVEHAEGGPAHVLLLLRPLVDASGDELRVVDLAASIHVDVGEDLLELFRVSQPRRLAEAAQLRHGEDSVLVCVQLSEGHVELVQPRLVELPRKHTSAEMAEAALLVEVLHSGQRPLQYRLLHLRRRLPARKPRVGERGLGAEPLSRIDEQQAADQVLSRFRHVLPLLRLEAVFAAEDALLHVRAEEGHAPAEQHEK